jgi:hypothetical protein
MADSPFGVKIQDIRGVSLWATAKPSLETAVLRIFSCFLTKISHSCFKENPNHKLSGLNNENNWPHYFSLFIASIGLSLK